MVLDDRQVIEALKGAGHTVKDAVAYVMARKRAMQELEEARTAMRDGIAARAMPVLQRAMFDCGSDLLDEDMRRIAHFAYRQADAMLEARKPKQEGEPS